MNVIFGSGIIGLLARMILGDSWTVIPFYKSRFFSFNPALDDNYIISDDRIDPYIKDIADTTKFLYLRGWSIQGHIYKEWNSDIYQSWAYKTFGNNIPSQLELYMQTRMNLQVYNIRVNQLYEKLLAKYSDDLKEELKKGQITEIGDHYFIRNNIKYEFENAVNTIPLDALSKFLNWNIDLKSKDVHFYHIQTNNLNFEGINQLFVVDQTFSFYKVTNIAPNRYLFYVHEDIQDPGIYFMLFMDKFDILDGTTIANALPLGEIPKLDKLEKFGIFSVGSCAQWDWCMDVGSCILRIINYSYRGNKPSDKTRIV